MRDPADAVATAGAGADCGAAAGGSAELHDTDRARSVHTAPSVKRRASDVSWIMMAPRKAHSTGHGCRAGNPGLPDVRSRDTRSAGLPPPREALRRDRLSLGEGG